MKMQGGSNTIEMDHFTAETIKAKCPDGIEREFEWPESVPADAKLVNVDINWFDRRGFVIDGESRNMLEDVVTEEIDRERWEEGDACPRAPSNITFLVVVAWVMPVLAGIGVGWLIWG